MRPIPEAAVELVARWEGLKLKAYFCPAGVLTIGYGSTGPHVTPGLVITKAQAKALLKDDLKIAARRLEAKIGPVVDDLTDNQYAALLSFVFNLGVGKAKPEWNIWKILRAKAFDQVPAQLMRFVNAGGKKLQGLVNRRTDEVRLWSTDEPGSTEDELPSSSTRVMDTPPAPMEKPVATSKSFVTTAVTALAAAPVAVQQVNQAIEPYSDKSPLIGQMVAGLATVAAVLAVLALVFQWLKHRNAQQ